MLRKGTRVKIKNLAMWTGTEGTIEPIPKDMSGLREKGYIYLFRNGSIKNPVELALRADEIEVLDDQVA